MTTAADLYAELVALTRRGWRSHFEVDELGEWWLVEDGWRRKNPWKPADEVDMLVGVAMLYILNEAGSKFSIPPEYADRLSQRSVAVFRSRLLFAAMGLYRRIRY